MLFYQVLDNFDYLLEFLWSIYRPVNRQNYLQVNRTTLICIIMQISGDLIYELKYVLEIEYQYRPVVKYTNQLLFQMACIPVYTATACKFRVHFLELVKYSFHPYTKIELYISIDSSWRNRSLHYFRKAFFCKLLDVLRKQK